jgi:hypothetical protein
MTTTAALILDAVTMTLNRYNLGPIGVEVAGDVVRFEVCAIVRESLVARTYWASMTELVAGGRGALNGTLTQALTAEIFDILTPR